MEDNSSQKYSLLNGHHKIETRDEIQLEGEFTNGQLNGHGVMILKDARRVLIGQFKKGRLYTGYIVAKAQDANITHIHEGRINFDFRVHYRNIDETIPDTEIVIKVKSILQSYWDEAGEAEGDREVHASESEWDEE